MGHALLWIPRVALFPLFALSEYGLRVPLGWLVTTVQEDHIDERFKQVFHPTDSVSIIPNFFADLGLISNETSMIPTAGVYFAWDHAFARRNSIHSHASTGGPGYWYLVLADHYTFAPRSVWSLQASYIERSDWRFYGLGWTSEHSDEQRFDWARTDVNTSASIERWSHVKLDLFVGARYDHFGTALVPIGGQSVPGYGNFTSVYGRARFFVDTRPLNRPNTTGIRVGGFVEYGADATSPWRRWVVSQCEGSLFWQVMSPGRVLELHAAATVADSLTSDPVPFIDLATLGGWETMRGWYYGRFRGQSTAVFSATYRYPMWHSLDGAVVLEAGNAFGHDLSDFDVTRLHGSLGVGVRSTGTRDSSIDVLVAVGSTRFDEAFGIESVRVAIGFNGDP